ncbi:MAG TPA: secretin N-terminal domain-containing protein [Ideonella sp.]|uniref:secretin N-terminal domain-containing protein n=1 Tax=Ideonella sp. TaxID=1929293 RepID=UPI002E3605AD|nr:secretin N-terminal domain-containing protein [Ideonella sp.]HEX5688083.1 secretin N-terminal domain-containing protein [Ideonella sp.]
MLAISLAVMAGCASNPAYRDGQELLAQDRPVEALERFEQAAKAEPGSAQVRAAWLRLRTRLATSWLEEARREREAAEFDRADDLYRKVLRADPTNEAAVLGLKAVERERVWERQLDQANISLEQKNFEQARSQLRTVLAESPRNPRAQQLQQRLESLESKPSAEMALGPAYRKVLSLEFKDAPLKSVFEVIAKTSGLNFVFDRDVRTDQKTSLYLRNGTVEAAVSRLLLSNQLAQRVLDANSVLIYPDTPAKQKDYQLLSVRTFYLSNGDAKAIANSIKAILKVKDVVVDERLNAMVVRDSSDAIKMVERMVALLDLPEPEVMLEVEVLEVKRSDLLNLGVRWPDQASLSPLASGSGTQLTLSDLRRLNGGTVGVSVNPLTISARQDGSTANILANPKIRAKSREKARVLIGDRVPNITSTSTSTGFVSDSVNYIDVGLKLEVEPTVYPEGDVAIKVALEVSSLVSQVQTKSGTLAYQIGTRSAATVLRLRDGENQILAGLINDEERRSVNQVPALGSAPIVGKLFGGSTDETAKSEIVLSITPRVLRNIQRPDASLLDFESGTDSGLRSGGGAVSGAATGFGQPTAGLPTGQAAGPVSSSTPSPPASGQDQAGIPSGSLPPAADVKFLWGTVPALKPGQVAQVPLQVEAGKPIRALPLALGFDAAALEVVDVLEGEFLAQGGIATTFEKRVDPSGQVLATIKRNGTAGASGAGTVMTLSLRALKVSPAAIVRVLTIAPEGEAGRSVTYSAPSPLQLTVAP